MKKITIKDLMNSDRIFLRTSKSILEIEFTEFLIKFRYNEKNIIDNDTISIKYHFPISTSLKFDTLYLTDNLEDAKLNPEDLANSHKFVKLVQNKDIVTNQPIPNSYFVQNSPIRLEDFEDYIDFCYYPIEKYDFNLQRNILGGLCRYKWVGFAPKKVNVVSKGYEDDRGNPLLVFNVLTKSFEQIEHDTYGSYEECLEDNPIEIYTFDEEKN